MDVSYSSGPSEGFCVVIYKDGIGSRDHDGPSWSTSAWCRVIFNFHNFLSIFLTQFFSENAAFCGQYMVAISQTPKFSMVRRFLTKSEKRKVAALVSALETLSISSDDLEQIKKAFKIS